VRSIYTVDDDASADQIGAKAAALRVLAARGVSVPAWFAVSPAAFEQSLSPDTRRALDDTSTTTASH
jgi:hypothetical protein